MKMNEFVGPLEKSPRENTMAMQWLIGVDYFSPYLPRIPHCHAAWPDEGLHKVQDFLPVTGDG